MNHLRQFYFLWAMALWCAASCPCLGSEAKVEEAITQAGNADSDAERLEILKKLRASPGIEDGVADDLDTVIAEVNLWLHAKKLDYWFPPFPFDEEFPVIIWRITERDLGLLEDSPLYPLTWLYRARYMSWSIIELGGSIDAFPDRRRKFYGKIREYLEKYVDRFPENRVARMYLGEPMPPKKLYPPVAGAPEWAVYHREYTERLADLAEWWIDNRMQESGEFGGNWNDDVEMVNDDWGHVMRQFQDPKVNRAAKRFFNSLWNTPRMKGGYPDYYPLEDDVAHSHEETNKTIFPMLDLEPDSEVWWNRVHRIFELCAGDWSGRNERGYLQFKSNYISPTRVNLDPRKSYDAHDHNGLLKPVLALWERTGDEEIGKFVLDRLETYLAAAKSSEAGKPPGVLPVAIHWPDGGIAGQSGKWWDPGWVPDDQLRSRPIRPWSPWQGGIVDHLVIAYEKRGDVKYLEPIWAQLRLRMAYLEDPGSGEGEPGSARWVGAKTGNALDRYAALHHEVTGSDEFAALIPAPADEISDPEERRNKRRDELAANLRNYARSLRWNFEAMTSECRHTDRVFKMRRLWEHNKLYPDQSIPIVSDRQGFAPDTTVRWLTRPREIAAVELEASSTSLVAELFHFGQSSRSMGVEFKQIQEGAYRFLLTALAPERRVLVDEVIDLDGRRPQQSFALPSRQPCRLQVVPVDAPPVVTQN